MGLESTSLISGLNEAWPTGTDPRSEGDDHIRTLKTTLKTAFTDTSTTLTTSKKLLTTASTTSASGFNVPPGAKPTFPNDGDMWCKTDGFYGHVNGVDYGPFGTAVETATEILTKIKTVDGAGSGLDADLLDGQQGSYYAPLNSPSFTGSPQAPTPTWPGTAHDIATVAHVESATEGKLNADGGTMFGPLRLPNGSNTVTSLRFSSTAGTGFYGDASNISIAIGGSTRFSLGTYSMVTGVPLTLPASWDDAPSLNVPHGDPPTSPTNGDMWTTIGGVWTHVNGATQRLVPDAPSDGSEYVRKNASWYVNSGGGLPLTGGTLTGPLQLPYGSSTDVALRFDSDTGTGIFGETDRVVIAINGDYSFSVTQTEVGFTGKLGTNASSSTQAGFNIAPGVAPTSPSDGDIWMTDAGLFLRTDGAVQGPLGTGGGGGGVEEAPIDGTAYNRKDGDWEAATGGGGGVADAPTDGRGYFRKDSGWRALDDYYWNGSIDPPNTGEISVDSLSYQAFIYISFSDVTGYNRRDELQFNYTKGRTIVVRNIYSPYNWKSWQLTTNMDDMGSYGKWEVLPSSATSLIYGPIEHEPDAGIPDTLYNSKTFARRDNDWLQIPVIHQNDGHPASYTGDLGDYCFDTDNGIIYGPKVPDLEVGDSTAIHELADSTLPGGVMYGTGFNFTSEYRIFGVDFYVDTVPTTGKCWVYLFDKNDPTNWYEKVEILLDDIGTGWNSFEAFTADDWDAFPGDDYYVAAILFEDTAGLIGKITPSAFPIEGGAALTDGFSGTTIDECPLTPLSSSAAPCISLLYAPVIHVEPWPPFGLPPDDGVVYGRKGDGSWEPALTTMPTDFTYNDSGAAPTVDGEITFDDASIGSATTMFIHHKDKDGTTVRHYTRASLKKGSRIVIRNTDDLTKWYMIDIESDHTNHGTYDDWAISPVSTGLSSLTAYGAAVIIEFRGIAEAPDDDVFYARRNTVWEAVPTITVSSTEPSSPAVGDIWIDTT